MALPALPDELWMDIIWYAGFDDVWTLESSKNVHEVHGYFVEEDDENYLNGDPWFFVGPAGDFEAIFGREPEC